MNTELNNEIQNETIPSPIPTLEETPKPKKKGKKILILLAVMVLIIASITTYYFYTKTETVVFKNSLKTLENFVKYLQDPVTLDQSDEFSMNGEFKMSMNNEMDNEEINQIIDIIKDSSMKFSLNSTSDKTSASFYLNKDNKALAGVKVYSTEEKGYMYLDKIFNKYIEMEELKGMVGLTTSNEEDSEYLGSVILKSLTNNINKEDYKTGKANITIDEKEKAVNTLKLEYNEKQIVELIKKIIEDIKKDTRASEILSNTFPEFEEFNMDDLITDEEHMSVYTYVIYTDKLTNSVLGIDLLTSYYEEEYNYDACDYYYEEEDSNVESMSNEIAYEDEMYTTDEDCMETKYTKATSAIEYRKNKIDTITVKTNDELAFTATLENNKDVTTLTFLNKENEVIGTVKLTNNENLLKLEVNIKDEKDELKMDITNNIKEVSKGKEYNVDTTITIYAKAEDEVIIDANATLNYNVKTTATIEEMTGATVKFDEMTEEDMASIMTKVMEILAETIQ